MVVRQNREVTDRPVIRMLRYADGTDYKEEVEKDLLKYLTVFIVDTLSRGVYSKIIYEFIYESAWNFQMDSKAEADLYKKG